MKTIFLAGGFGTRLSEYTETVPKPMVPIGGVPILQHIMNRYLKYGFNDFYVALGYKADVIKEYFLNYHQLNSDFTIDLRDGTKKFHQSRQLDARVTLVDTGKQTMTGGRVKRLQSYIGNETSFLTYGDGVSDINIEQLLKFHRSHGKMVTLTAVRPQARFGELHLDGLEVKEFQEKPQLHNGWINGGFFVIEPEFFSLIDGDDTFLEREPMEQLAKMGELMAFRHEGFWQCMDTNRDKVYLEKLWSQGCPW